MMMALIKRKGNLFLPNKNIVACIHWPQLCLIIVIAYFGFFCYLDKTKHFPIIQKMLPPYIQQKNKALDILYFQQSHPFPSPSSKNRCCCIYEVECCCHKEANPPYQPFSRVAGIQSSS